MNANAWMMNRMDRKPLETGPFPACPVSTVPADLREWVNESTLVDWVLEVVSDLDARLLRLPNWRDTRDPVPVPTMLSVLAYCYATGRYESDEIETLARTDETIRYLAANHFVTSMAIRRFRRVHRGLLRSSLLGLHQRAWLHHFGPGATDASVRRDEPAAGLDHRLAIAAEAMVQRAVLSDTMAMDL